MSPSKAFHAPHWFWLLPETYEEETVKFRPRRVADWEFKVLEYMFVELNESGGYLLTDGRPERVASQLYEARFASGVPNPVMLLLSQQNESSCRTT